MTTFGPTAGISLRCIPERRATLPEWVKTQDDLRRAMMNKGPGDAEETAGQMPAVPRTNRKIGHHVLTFLIDYGASTNVQIAEGIGATVGGVNRRLRAEHKKGHVEILQGKSHRGHGDPAVWIITDAGTDHRENMGDQDRWTPGPNTLAGRILTYLTENGEGTAAQIGNGIGSQSRRVGEMATELRKAGYIKPLRKDVNFIVWGLA